MMGVVLWQACSVFVGCVSKNAGGYYIRFRKVIVSLIESINSSQILLQSIHWNLREVSAR